jgi:hypothetical protein
MHATRLRAALVAGFLVLALVSHPVHAEESTAVEAGTGVGAALATLVYGPVKVVYSALGLVFGGFAWGLSGGDSSVMSAVITPAVRGDYVVTPSHLTGDRSLEFFGREQGYASSPPAAAVVVEETVEESYDPY